MRTGPPAARLPRRRRGRERVAGLMAAAAALFVERGYEATTMTEIAARAGASIGALYLFFPTKPVLAQAMLAMLADELSARLDALAARLAGQPAPAIADALFGTLVEFLTAHPVYAVLIERPGQDGLQDGLQDGWRATVRARRRAQIAALFAASRPALPEGQPERLAVIVPQLMRATTVLSQEVSDYGPLPQREAVLDELRAMLRRHLGG